MKYAISGLLIFTSLVIISPCLHAARQINLRHHPVALQSFAPGDNHGLAMKEISREIDTQNITHVRLQETYLGYDVLGADMVLHAPQNKNIPRSLIYVAALDPHAEMNGLIYEDIDKDLKNSPRIVFTREQAEKALKQGISLYPQKTADITREQSQLMVWPEENKARWIYRVSFYAESAETKPVLQVYLLDALTMELLASWDDIQTLAAEGGGFGGNPKMGQQIYDGLDDHLPKLIITRNNEQCFLQNENIVVKNFQSKEVVSFRCAVLDADHNNIYWNASFDAVNGGYSPANDALFAATMTKQMYEDWCGVSLFKNPDGRPQTLTLLVHKKVFDGAYWDGQSMIFGDGYRMFYPLTSVDVTAHELSHGFTHQHSALLYMGQSGAINESFSDMAGIAAAVYAYGPNDNRWQIAGGIYKASNQALRYMDKPSRDCGAKPPGRLCSIDYAGQYRNGLDVHYASGIYNHFFYLLATTPNWDVKKAFGLMVHANRYYWTAGSSFNEAACNVMSAARQLNYDAEDVRKAFDAVQVNYRQFC